MKHIKIMSGKKTLYEKNIKNCEDCILFIEEDLFSPEGCILLKGEIYRGGMELFDPIPKECPLQDVPSDITYKD